MPPLKICMLSPTGPSLASARHLLSAGRALAARGIEVAAVVPHHYYLPFEEAGGADEENLGGVAVRHVRLPSRWRGSVRTHFFPAGYWSWGMVRRAMETPFDIVHAMKPYYTSGPAGLLLSILTGKPLVLECDDLEGRDGWARSLVEEPLFGFKRRLIETFERRLPALADAVIASSRALEEILLARGVARGRLFYIPYCVEEYMTRRGDGAAARSAFGLGEDPTAIYCGALHPHNYDVDMLIPAMEHVRAAIPRARMLVVGDGGARPGLERAASERGLLGGAISFAGWVAVERIPDYIAAADVAVVPLRDTPASRCRGLSKVLEYLCQGVPVVMPRVGQAEELTDGGAVGLLVRPGDARALADGIIELLRDPVRAKEMGARGRRHATTCFSADGAASARIEVYRSLLSTQALSGKREAGWPGVAPAAVRDKRRLPEKPFLNVRMDVTNTCNLKCRMCYFSLPGHKTIDGSPPRHMPLPLLEKIARDVFPHARHLALSCGAESLMYPHFDLFLQLVSASHIQSTELITNAQLLDERRSRLLIDARLTRLSVSIDAATPGTYEHIRQGARFERLVDNIHTLQRLKKELASNVPALHLQYVLMRSNIEELPRAVELAKELGAQSFSCMHMAPIHGLDVVGESLYHHKELANCKLDEASAVAKKLMLPAVFPEKFGAAPGKSTSSAARAKCPYDPWHFLFITESGIAYPCGWLTKQTVAGNFTTQYLEDIWFGEEYERLRREIQTGDLREKCLQCPATAAGDVNDPDAFSER